MTPASEGSSTSSTPSRRGLRGFPTVPRERGPRVLRLKRNSKVYWMGGPDCGKTTHAKKTMLRWKRVAVWDPGHEFDPAWSKKHGFVIAHDMAGVRAAAAKSARIVLQPPRPTSKEGEAARRLLGDEFCLWVVNNVRHAFVYLDEPHTIFEKSYVPPGLAELLRRGHKPQHDLAMGWSAWGAREVPNDLENVTHMVVFRPVERNDVERVKKYLGDEWGPVVTKLPNYWHVVKQPDPNTGVPVVAVFPPIEVE